MSEKYRRVYGLLKRAGFSPAKAVEVLYDAKRGSSHAIGFIRACRRTS